MTTTDTITAIIPNTTELYAAQIPALHTLMSLGWDYLPPEQCTVLRDGIQNVVLKPVLVEVLQQRRFEYKGQWYPLSPNAIDQIIRELTAPPMQEGLLAASEYVYHRLTLGITVTEFVAGKKHSVTVPIIDWQDVANNRFQVTQELEVLTTDGTRTRRPDVVGFVNGLPLVVIEAKRPDSGNPNKSLVDEGISQTLRNQNHDEIPLLFAYSQLLLAISGTEGRYATTKTPKKFWARWHEEYLYETQFDAIKNQPLSATQQEQLLHGQRREVQQHFQRLWAAPQFVTDQDRLLISLLSRERLLEFIRYFILFDRKAGKIAARYQQAFAIKALLQQVSQKNAAGAREGGVIWHTTGSGKSFTMVFLCKALLLDEHLAQCRVLVITDRRDLEKQLARTFLTGGALGLREQSDKGDKRAKAATGRDLAQRIGQGNERIIFSIINKFSTASKLPECHNPSADLIVLVDEGHRSQYGENHERMKKALPNAAYVAFTGTPLLKDDKTTNKFGPIVHVYTMQRAVQDGTVTPLLYEERMPVLDVNDKAIDNWFERITASLSNQQKHDLKEKYGKKGPVYGSMNRIELIAWDIASHFQDNFKSLGLDLKGQVAADSKRSAIRYKQALDATGLVSSAVIISPPDTREGHEEVDEATLPEVQQWWAANVPGDAEEYERKVLEDFSEPGKPDLLIVVDKLLTGFDEPRNAVLYIDKPLKQHNLMQAIARVNRLHDDKPYGLLIDYRGILKELDTAITEYQDLAERTQGGFDIDDIEGLYRSITTEYKRLPALHNRLWAIFASVNNKADREQYRHLLIPRYITDADGNTLDTNQKVREDFYQALTEFSTCLKIALGSRAFFQDTGVSEQQIATYKKDLKFFAELRRTAMRDAQETVDYSAYEDQVRRLVDRHVVAQEIREPEGVYLVNELAQKDHQEQDQPEQWSDDKLRNEADLIRSRMTKTIEQELATDPYAQTYFSELLKRAIEEAAALFDHPYQQYALFKDFETQIREHRVEGIPQAITDNKHARAYFGVLKMLSNGDISGDSNRSQSGEHHKHGAVTPAQEQALVDLSLQIDRIIDDAVAENSLSPHNIEATIRQQLLPLLFHAVGLENAKKATEQLIEITRIGLARKPH